jgi:hypothetical protein
MVFKTRAVRGVTLRDGARGKSFRVSLDGSPEFLTKRIAHKTTARQGSAKNRRLTHLLACVCLRAYASQQVRQPSHFGPERP